MDLSNDEPPPLPPAFSGCMKHMQVMLLCFLTLTLSCSQGKEIIEFYLKELEDEGVTQVPRWSPSSHSLPLCSPTSLSAIPPDLAVIPAVSVPLAADAKDGTTQDAKQDSSMLQADSLVEILAGTPEGTSLPQIVITVAVQWFIIIRYESNIVIVNKIDPM